MNENIYNFDNIHVIQKMLYLIVLVMVSQYNNILFPDIGNEGLNILRFVGYILVEKQVKLAYIF